MYAHKNQLIGYRIEVLLVELLRQMRLISRTMFYVTRRDRESCACDDDEVGAVRRSRRGSCYWLLFHRAR